jgi:hypothetical protein
VADLQPAVQAALYDALDGNLDGPEVYDGPPQGAAEPYVEIGETTTTDDSTKSADGQTHTITLHIWSRDAGQMEAKRIMKRIHDLLHRQAANVSGERGDAWWSVGYTTTQREPDGLTVHGIMRISVTTESA